MRIQRRVARGDHLAHRQREGVSRVLRLRWTQRERELADGRGPAHVAGVRRVAARHHERRHRERRPLAQRCGGFLHVEGERRLVTIGRFVDAGVGDRVVARSGGRCVRREGNEYTWAGIWQFHCRLQQERYRYGEKREDNPIDEALKSGRVDKTSRSDQCHRV